jgi:hypothetical protein
VFQITPRLRAAAILSKLFVVVARPNTGDDPTLETKLKK